MWQDFESAVNFINANNPEKSKNFDLYLEVPKALVKLKKGAVPIELAARIKTIAQDFQIKELLEGLGPSGQLVFK